MTVPTGHRVHVSGHKTRAHRAHRGSLEPAGKQAHTARRAPAVRTRPTRAEGEALLETPRRGRRAPRRDTARGGEKRPAGVGSPTRPTRRQRRERVAIIERNALRPRRNGEAAELHKVERGRTTRPAPPAAGTEDKQPRGGARGNAARRSQSEADHGDRSRTRRRREPRRRSSDEAPARRGWRGRKRRPRTLQRGGREFRQNADRMRNQSAHRVNRMSVRTRRRRQLQHQRSTRETCANKTTRSTRWSRRIKEVSRPNNGTMDTPAGHPAQRSRTSSGRDPTSAKGRETRSWKRQSDARRT